MSAGYSFRPRAWAWILAAVACAAFISLGHWQRGRAQEKRALGEQLAQAMKSAPAELSPAAEAPDLVHRRVGARGIFQPQYTLLIDNRSRRGRRGYEVVTPLRLAGSDVHVLVNRGWIEAPPRREVIPQVATPSAEVRIEGIGLARFPRMLKVDGPPAGPVRQQVDLGEFVAETGLALKALVIEQHSELGDGLLRDWPPPDLGIDKHDSYALQWYSLAALALVLAAVFSFRKA